MDNCVACSCVCISNLEF